MLDQTGHHRAKYSAKVALELNNLILLGQEKCEESMRPCAGDTAGGYTGLKLTAGAGQLTQLTESPARSRLGPAAEQRHR